eukprot:scaffold138967_cov27-Tisochrysis_lutea.AAC.1
MEDGSIPVLWHNLNTCGSNWSLPHMQLPEPGADIPALCAHSVECTCTGLASTVLGAPSRASSVECTCTGLQTPRLLHQLPRVLPLLNQCAQGWELPRMRHQLPRVLLQLLRAQGWALPRVLHLFSACAQGWRSLACTICSVHVHRAGRSLACSICSVHVHRAGDNCAWKLSLAC